MSAAGIVAVGFLVVMVVLVLRGTRGGGSRRDGNADYDKTGYAGEGSDAGHGGGGGD